MQFTETKRSRIRCAALFLFFISAAVMAKPGDIISLSYERSYTPEQVSSFISPLYAGYDQPEALYTVDVYQLVFESTYSDGISARAYAQVFLPVFPEGEREVRDLYVFAPGSTGLLDNCRASREHEAGIRWGLYRAHVLSHSARGTIGIQPDYLGFRDPVKYQQYMVAASEAAVILDSVRVMDQVYRETGYTSVVETVNFAGGFSQGGHAILAAADYRSEYAPEIELDAVVGYGATADPLQLLLEYPSVAPMLVYIYSELYGTDKIDPYDIFRDQYARWLEDDVLSQCVGGMQSYYPHGAEGLYTADFYAALRNHNVDELYPGIREVMQLNTTGYNSYGTEILLTQGSDDIVIFPETQIEYARQLESRGLDVELKYYEGSRHDTRQASYYDVRQWMNAILRRERILRQSGPNIYE